MKGAMTFYKYGDKWILMAWDGERVFHTLDSMFDWIRERSEQDRKDAELKERMEGLG